MSPARPDRRINHTREPMFQAFFALMPEKRYDDITVQERTSPKLTTICRI